MREDLNKIFDSVPVVNTHSHHRPDEEQAAMDLTSLLETTYIGEEWTGQAAPKKADEVPEWLSHIGTRSYFIWLQKAMQELFEISEPLSETSFDRYQEAVIKTHRTPEWRLNVLREKCRYTSILVDAFWEPGSDLGHPDLMTPAFRANSFLFSCSPETLDHNGNNAQQLYGKGKEFRDLGDYVSLMRDVIAQKKGEGCVSVKIPMAYDGSLAVGVADAKLAQEALLTSTEENAEAFRSYIFREICDICAQEDLPLQIHTGLGKIRHSNAMGLRDVIYDKPETKFVLMHGSYPWTDDYCALIHNCHNVYADICWMPLISPARAADVLREILDICDPRHLTWGCDTWTCEESYGALLAMRSVLVRTLEAKIREDGWNADMAGMLIRNIMYRNATELYGVR